jgi:hypothetical protein
MHAATARAIPLFAGALVSALVQPDSGTASAPSPSAIQTAAEATRPTRAGQRAAQAPDVPALQIALQPIPTLPTGAEWSSPQRTVQVEVKTMAKSRTVPSDDAVAGAALGGDATAPPASTPTDPGATTASVTIQAETAAAAQASADVAPAITVTTPLRLASVHPQSPALAGSTLVRSEPQASIDQTPRGLAPGEEATLATDPHEDFAAAPTTNPAATGAVSAAAPTDEAPPPQAASATTGTAMAGEREALGPATLRLVPAPSPAVEPKPAAGPPTRPTTPEVQTPQDAASLATAPPSAATAAATPIQASVSPVAQAAAPSPAAQLAPVLVSITGGVSGSAPGAHQVLTVTLQPVSLGSVQVRVEHAAGAPPSVAITAARPDTLALLVRDQGQLHAALDQAGVTAEGRTLTFHLAEAPASPLPSVASGADAASVSAAIPTSPAPSETPAQPARNDSDAFAAGSGTGGSGQEPPWRPSGATGAPGADAEAEADGMVSTPPSAVRWLRAGLDITA